MVLVEHLLADEKQEKMKEQTEDGAQMEGYYQELLFCCLWGGTLLYCHGAQEETQDLEWVNGCQQTFAKEEEEMVYEKPREVGNELTVREVEEEECLQELLCPLQDGSLVCCHGAWEEAQHHWLVESW